MPICRTGIRKLDLVPALLLNIMGLSTYHETVPNLRLLKHKFPQVNFITIVRIKQKNSKRSIPKANSEQQ